MLSVRQGRVLMLQEFAAGRLRWERFEGPTTHGVLCWGGMRYPSKLGRDWVPELPETLAAQIIGARPRDNPLRPPEIDRKRHT